MNGGDHPARPSPLPAVARAPGRGPRALRPAAPPGRDRCRGQRRAAWLFYVARRGPRGAGARACRSRASASTRSSTIRAGRTTGTATSACSATPTATASAPVYAPLAEELAPPAGALRAARTAEPRSPHRSRPHDASDRHVDRDAGGRYGPPHLPGPRAAVRLALRPAAAAGSSPACLRAHRRRRRVRRRRAVRRCGCWSTPCRRRAADRAAVWTPFALFVGADRRSRACSGARPAGSPAGPSSRPASTSGSTCSSTSPATRCATSPTISPARSAAASPRPRAASPA